MTQLRGWLQANATLAYFLFAQAVALIGGGAWGLTYMVQLENRVTTLEVRGSPHLTIVDNRLTVLESQTKENKDRLERVVDIMTKKLNATP